MPDEFAQNPWQPEQSAQAQAAMPSVAPPPNEVSIRTMASDLASLGETGGGPPQPRNVAVPYLNQAGPDTNAPATVLKSKFLIWGVAVAVGAGALFLAGYYLIPLFSSPKSGSSGPSAVSRVTSSSAPLVSLPPASAHQSVFRQPVDGTFILNIGSSTEGLAPYGSRVNGFIAGLSSSSTFLGVTPQDPAGSPVPAALFLDSIRANVFASNFITSNFNSDFTFFLYKDKAGVWPGYVFQLALNKSPILLQQDLRKIETAPNLKNLFLNDPGFPASAFQDSLISGQPVRIANFSDKKSVLAYGWFFNKYLIVSTSIEGLKQTLVHF